jgi:GrpB-like predicted nucleotidyltransferase (UPF0157 family)
MQKTKPNIDSLTKEELGQLFPIEIVPYNPGWKATFDIEKNILLSTLSQTIILRIEHFGSTAVPGLSAKTIIDILIEIPPLTDKLKEKIIEIMKTIAYDFIWRKDDVVPYMMFAKGYTLEGIKGQAFHIHIADKTHSLWDRVYFRDYLIQHPENAKEYEKLKFRLMEKHKYDRENYTNAKTEFITRITELAKSEVKKTFNK